MSFEPESFAPAAEIMPERDLQIALRAFAKSVGRKRSGSNDYPRRPELLKILGDVRGSIDRINAPLR